MSEIEKSPQEIAEERLKEVRVIISCKIHPWYSGTGSRKPPVDGCIGCADTLIKTMIMRMKGDPKENLDKIEPMIHAISELDDEGKFDYKPERTGFKFEKGKD